MSFLAATLTVIIPPALFLIPGVGIIRRPTTLSEIPPLAAQAVLWSIALNTLIAFTSLALGQPVWLPAAAVAAVITIAGLLSQRRGFSLWALWACSLLLLAATLIFAAFTVPFLLNQDGLPTGDAQKAIFWAQEIVTKQHLPNYAASLARLNRDPVDFYTPGLHAITALVMQLTPASLGGEAKLIAVGLLSIAFAIAAALISWALAHEILPPTYRQFSFAVPVLVLTHYRFLRYLREPGYHLQNIVGELLAFGLLIIALRLIRRWHWGEATLAVFLGIALALTHQFSAFIAAFLLIPLAGIFFSRHRHDLDRLTRNHQGKAAAVGLLLLLLIAAGFSLGLHEKIPHLFTTTPHLANELPSLSDYPRLIGGTWLLFGLAGLALMIRHKVALPFVASVVVLLLLSQGPRLYIDIPPVRALFYSVIPLSITAAYALARLTNKLPRVYRLTLVLAVVLVTVNSVYQAYQLSPTARTNSTLAPEQLWLHDWLQEQPAHHILTDDYNRRAASWLLLTKHGMFTRLAADIERQMREAVQSPTRQELYVKQLDFEKIFALGSLPEITELMAKHDIAYITGITGSSATSFQHNPALREVARGGDIVLYANRSPAGKTPNSALRASLGRPGFSDKAISGLPAEALAKAGVKEARRNNAT